MTSNSRFRIVISLLFFISAFVVYTKKIHAFVEDFNHDFSNPSAWNMSTNSGTISFTESHLQLLNLSGANSFPYVKSTNDIFPSSGNFGVKIDFNFISAGNFGDGIGMSPNSLSNGTILGSDLHGNLLFWVWHDPSGLGLYTTICPEINPYCTQQYTRIYSFDNPNFSQHFIALSMDDKGRYHLFLDSDSNEIFTSSVNQQRPTSLWFGSPEHTFTTDKWNSLQVDKVEVQNTYPFSTPTPTPTPTPSPTPTPTPEPLKPIIIIPGLGASWDFGAILNGTAGTNWKIPSFIKLYDNLIDSLKNAGYIEDKNLFVFGYDWRKPLNDLASNLSTYIDTLVASGKIDGTEKLNLIGHSYGGLVARTYGQKIGAGKINKIITAGSPHQGAIDAYGIWEGATVWKNVWWQRAALELMTKLNQQAGENKVDTVRRLIPGIKDTLPVFDFLKKNGVLISSGSLQQTNSTLIDLNGEITSINNLLWANGGKENTTDQFLKIEERSWLDQTLGLWQDGKPITGSPFETTSEGDGSILSTSSVGTFSNQSLLSANHEEIIAKQIAVEKIFEQLGLDKNKVLINTAIDSKKKVFIASLRSPGTLHVCDQSNICDSDLGVYLPGDKLFFFPGYAEQALTAKIDASGETGGYHLYLGKMDDGRADWKDTKGKLILPTQIDNYQVSIVNGETVISGDSEITKRTFDEDAKTLNDLSPNWDNNKLSVARSETEPRDKRIAAIRQSRELLSALAIKAYKANEPKKIEAIITVWKDIDNLAIEVIGEGNDNKVIFLNANILQVEAYEVIAKKLLKNSSSYYAGVFYNLFSDQFAKAKEISSQKRDLSLDKTLSSRYLLLTAQKIR